MRISSSAIGVLFATTASAFHTPSNLLTSSRTHHHATLSQTKLYSTPTKERSSTSSRTNSVANLSQQMREMQSQLSSQNEEADLIIQALRGKNMNDDDRAMEGLKMNLVEFDDDDKTTDAGDRLPLEYDPIAFQKYYKKRPNLVISRILQVASSGGSVVLSFALDALTGKLKKDPDLEVKRAAQLRDTITSLGPFFIKLGQALSIRPDILSPRSMVELQKLCDKVPSFDSAIAFRTMEKELGRPVDEVFSEITPEPVAAASLGQVYKATLRSTGELVAVKVQRPKVLETVSLDLFLARELGLFLRNFPALSDRLDAVALLDEFAFRFYQELDYNLECDNGIKMKEQMKVLPDVVIPGCFPEFTSRRVHVAEWIDGEKLSQSTEDDVGGLVNLGVITYLTQLLDFGFFHADPVSVS